VKQRKVATAVYKRYMVGKNEELLKASDIKCSKKHQKSISASTSEHHFNFLKIADLYCNASIRCRYEIQTFGSNRMIKY